MKYNKIVLLTGMGGSAGIFLINHLKKNNFKVIAVDANSYAVGLLHADVSYIAPECTASNYLEVIKNICKKENVSFIIPLIDEELKLLKGLENDSFKVICPTIDFIEKTLDKYTLIESLSDFLSYLPKTFLFSDDFSSLEFPVIVKPKLGRGSKGVCLINNQSELEKFISTNCEKLEHFVIQEKIEGEEYTVSVVVNANNDLVSIVPKRILEKKGITNNAVTDFNQKIHDICEKITWNLKPKSPYNVQLILDNKNQEPYVFEINPRFSTTVTLTILAGIDEIMAPINFLINPEQQKPLERSFKNNLLMIRSIHEDYMEITEYQKRTSEIINVKTN
ncbi:MAG: ATP-grasp domain-containing protein [Alphaproteobacteria bacterium]|nr:ATP-grasp domain-containing protein [Alphaproteobacteria bacterium]